MLARQRQYTRSWLGAVLQRVGPDILLNAQKPTPVLRSMIVLSESTPGSAARSSRVCRCDVMHTIVAGLATAASLAEAASVAAILRWVKIAALDFSSVPEVERWLDV